MMPTPSSAARSSSVQRLRVHVGRREADLLRLGEAMVPALWAYVESSLEVVIRPQNRVSLRMTAKRSRTSDPGFEERKAKRRVPTRPHHT
jgi:hypothetical protein